VTSRALFSVGFLLLTLLVAERAEAQAPTPDLPTRKAVVVWDAVKGQLLASVDFRDVIDESIRQKLQRGLPTRILFTALAYRANTSSPISSSYLSCKVTWHVWEEMYRVEVSRSSVATTQRHWTPTLEGVLRRCAEITDLVLADNSELPRGVAVYFEGTVRINPLDEELMNRLRQWVTRPSRSTTAPPGSALFSTFTGLFMQRLGDAEKTLQFVTQLAVPPDRVLPKPP
jgi:hypothetical protein